MTARTLPRTAPERQAHVWVAARRAGRVTPAPSSPADVTPDAPVEVNPGWQALPGVDVTPTAAAWLDRLVAQLEADLLPVVVTSGRRGTRRQAEALAFKHARGEDLTGLYQQKDLIAEVLAVAPDVEAVTAVLDEQVARGRFLSPHMRDDAVDLRRWHRTPAQLKRLAAHCQALGAQTVLESDHLHVQHLTRSTS